ncbi:MAG: Rieske 2Fe-2S domain-containing protein, partial [Alphaproteobacteria bacterium]|nr:Rieske 2Fe-2S domain-containing protein [Alphaproteobacteria bacterium]
MPWSNKYPDLGNDPLPTEPYISEDHFALERDQVFRRSWLQVGRVGEIPQAGDYFVRDIAICNASILVIRGSDGVVRGFHNVCSHRSNRLVADERG